MKYERVPRAGEIAWKCQRSNLFFFPPRQKTCVSANWPFCISSPLTVLTSDSSRERGGWRADLCQRMHINDMHDPSVLLGWDESIHRQPNGWISTSLFLPCGLFPSADLYPPSHCQCTAPYRQGSVVGCFNPRPLVFVDFLLGFMHIFFWFYSLQMWLRYFCVNAL